MLYVFGDYTLDTQGYALSRAGAPVHVRPKVFQVLAYLLAHRDRVVPKPELMAHVWPGQSVSDETLDSCIALARRAVGDSARVQAVIQTRHGYGHRFVAAVEVRGHPPLADDAPAVVLALPRRPLSRGLRSQPRCLKQRSPACPPRQLPGVTAHAASASPGRGAETGHGPGVHARPGRRVDAAPGGGGVAPGAAGVFRRQPGGNPALWGDPPAPAGRRDPGAVRRPGGAGGSRPAGGAGGAGAAAALAGWCTWTRHGPWTRRASSARGCIRGGCSSAVWATMGA